jgi:hypothetical protein
VIHRRTVLLESPDSVVVDDILMGTGTHRIRVNWPLGPGAVRAEDGRVVLDGAAWTAVLTVEGILGAPVLQRGNMEEPGGPYVSTGYDRLVASAAWTWEGTVSLPTRWTTRIQVTRA